MHRFRLWAPKAGKASVQIAGQKYPLQKTAGGWWQADVEAANPGTDYAYFLNDEELALPDPRSLWQPNGIHGTSRVFDHKAFHWNDAEWQAPPLSSAIVYELHIGTFTPEGTFDAAQTKLDALRELGVTHVEIMPVNSFPGIQGWGYDGVDLFAPHEPYGGPEALKRLVNACHEKGLAVILDVVYNHFGPDGNYLGKFAPYLTDLHHTPWGDAVNLEDSDSYEVRRFFCDNALMWLRDYHFDGLRLDAVHAYMDRSAINFMEQIASEVHELKGYTGRNYVVIAESDLNDPQVVTAPEAGGYGMDAQWSDDFHHALFTLLHQEQGKGYYDDFGSLEKLVKSLTQIFVYDGEYSKYRQRHHGRPVAGLSAHHFIGFIQNHDQVGNRATGDRVEQIIGFDRAKVAAGVVLTAPFIPMIYQGEEYAASTPFQYFADHEDPETAKAVSAGRKKEFAAFGWDEDVIPDPEDPETFKRSKLNWDEVYRDRHREMLDWFKQMIHLRRSSPSLNDGDLSHAKVRYDAEKCWLVMDRGRMQILVNLGPNSVDLEVPARYTLAACSRPAVVPSAGGITLPADTFAVLSGEEI